MTVNGSIEFEVVQREDGRAVSRMPVGPGILNPYGTVHAGAIIWFADVTATALVLGKQDASAAMQGFPLAISLNANLLGNATSGSFVAESVFVKKGRTVMVVRTSVSDDQGKAIAEITTNHLLSR